MEEFFKNIGSLSEDDINIVGQIIADNISDTNQHEEIEEMIGILVSKESSDKHDLFSLLIFDVYKLLYNKCINKQLLEYIHIIEPHIINLCKDDNHPYNYYMLATIYFYLGDIYLQNKKYNKAEYHITKATGILYDLSETLPSNSDIINSISLCYGIIADIHIAKGENRQAQDIIEHRIKISSELNNPTPKNNWTKVNLIQAYMQLAELFNNEQKILKALAIYKEVQKTTYELCVNNPDNENYLDSLALVFLKMGIIDISIGSFTEGHIFALNAHNIWHNLSIKHPDKKYEKNIMVANEAMYVCSYKHNKNDDEFLC